ncbi:nuclear transport factor 2 family protein [Sphaerimonospora sp. CA-214678]|uniref:nuclear transport factor 2 family protein n=1 Tax=Sphaerimonospora sp. CA-214678 TaxID=3240029 RepID=UPI003D8AD963
MAPDDLRNQLEIRDLAARFTDAVNRRAPKEVAALFTEDGAWHVPGVPPAVGHEAVTGLLAGLLRNFSRLVQLTHSGHVDVAGETATATWYISEKGADSAGDTFEFTGVYVDRLVRTEQDGWRFAERSFGFLHRKGAGKERWYPHPNAVAD